MRKSAVSFLLCVAGCAILSLLLVGCGPPQREQTESELHLAALARAYGQYQAAHQGQPPPSEEALKRFVETMDKNKREAFGIGDPKKIFVSPRDKQPYVVLYGRQSANAVPNPANPAIIAYEKTGVNGMHYVAYATTAVEEVDSAKLQKLLASSK